VKSVAQSVVTVSAYAPATPSTRLVRSVRGPRFGDPEGTPRMNTGRGILLKLISAVLFAVMSALVRFLGDRYPIGEMMFFRSAFAILPVVVVYAWRGELVAAIRTERPLGQAGRGLLSIAGMFCNFGALARLPLVEATAISFTSPLIGVALSALVLTERVRIYRWSAVIIGFLGVLVVLAPHLGVAQMTATLAAAGSVAGICYAVAGSFLNAGTMIQTRRLAQSEATSSIVFYFSFICALVGLATWPFGWLMPTTAELATLIAIGLLGGTAHIVLTESYRHASASVVAPFDYTSMIWALMLGYLVFGEVPTVMVFVGAAIITAAGLFVIWRERQLGLAGRGDRRRTRANGH
jgi:drug/metabolite transporter (DMT)-like permease